MVDSVWWTIEENENGVWFKKKLKRKECKRHWILKIIFVLFYFLILKKKEENWCKFLGENEKKCVYQQQNFWKGQTKIWDNC